MPPRNFPEIMYLGREHLHRQYYRICIKGSTRSGVLLDSCLTMSSHINSVCKNDSFAIRKFTKLRLYLDEANAQKLVYHSFRPIKKKKKINLVFFWFSEQSKLQSIQNRAAKVITVR